MIVSDNGTELTSNAILAWLKDYKVEWHYIAPGRPMQNGDVESFICQRQSVIINTVIASQNPGLAKRQRFGELKV